MSLKAQMEQLEEKIAVLTERINEGDEWKRHLETWLVTNLGMNFPTHLSAVKDEKPLTNEVNDSSSKENEENQYTTATTNSTPMKTRAKRTYGAADPKQKASETKTYPKKKRISSGAVENHKGDMTNHDRGGTNGGLVPNHEGTVEIATSGGTTSYIVAAHEVVQSPDNEIIIENVNVKYDHNDMMEDQDDQSEPIEMNAVDGCTTETIITTAASEVDGTGEARYRIQEENNVLHIIKIEGTEGLTVDGEQAVINYGSALPIVHLTGVDGSSQLPGNLAVFSGPLGEETAIGFLNPDGSVTPCRPNVIISTNSSGIPVATQVQEVMESPGTPESKPPEEAIDPKGTFVCNVCGNSFQGLYSFRQHEKKSECRRIAKTNQPPPAPKTKKPESSPSSLPKMIDSAPASSSPAARNSLPPAANPSTLKFKCSMCGLCYASEAYLKFHMQKIHNVGR